MDDIGVYVHIPFCKKKCSYCDFNSYANREYLFQSYFKALEKEIKLELENMKKYNIKSIYIGGGTPSFVEESYLESVLDIFRDFIKNNTEVTVEINPGTINLNKLNVYKRAGINRISIGLQSTSNKTLDFIGRIHDYPAFLENYKLMRDIGFDNISVDLMFGIPGQSLEDWKKTLNEVLDLEPEHLSCYGLKIEEGTLFYRMDGDGKLDQVDDETERQMYYYAKEVMNERKYKHYEISNFALEGYESRHNLNYWNCGKYFGFGPGAHSYINERRFNNIYNLERYINHVNNGKNIKENEMYLTEKDNIIEYIILKLRLIDGFYIKDFNTKFRMNFLKEYEGKLELLIQKGLIQINDKICLTSKGLDLANQVFVEFV